MTIKWNGTFELPEMPLRKVVTAGGSVQQRPFRGASCRAEIQESSVRGHDLIRTDLLAPFNELLIRHKGARRHATDTPVLVSELGSDYSAWPSTTGQLQWDSLGRLAEYANSPDAVLELWQDKFRFRVERAELGQKGMRVPQLGALHAIAAHFAVGREFEPATVVLPTGTGKTETMLAAHVLCGLNKILVLAPSRVLRNQIGLKFATLGVLPLIGAVPEETPSPRVAVLRSGLISAESAAALCREANVIVALPNTLEASTEEAIETLTNQCTDLIVDEAHHVAAKTWEKVRSRFLSKRTLQFTATPFRQDGRRIGGRIIFNYKLGDAQDDGFYCPIKLKTVEEYGDRDAHDRAIAVAAVEALRQDHSDGFQHLMMARTRTRERADRVYEIYSSIAPDLNPRKVYTGPGREAANAAVLEELLAQAPGGCKIVVCVDMLGEGFDLPSLKVAALHDAHKSLAITLQFIGRFTRVSDSIRLGEATAIANIADQETESKLSKLYAEGADWDRIIRRLSEDKIDQEVRLQEVVFGLREEGDLSKHLSLWNLRPGFSTQFFRTQCQSWNPLDYVDALPKGAETWHAYNDQQSLFVAVICRSEEVKWGDYENVVDTIYDLVIMRWNSDLGVLYLYASDYSAMRTEQMALAVTDERTTLVTGDPIFRILNNVQLPLVKSLGSSRLGSISFTSYFGPNVTSGLADIERSQAELNNVACLGYEDGERVVWGGTKRRGKVWQVRRGRISDWMDWTSKAWSKVSHGSDDETNVVSGFLRPKVLSAAHESYPIAVQWGEQAQTSSLERQFLLFGQREVPLVLVGLDIAEVGEDGSILVRLSSDYGVGEYRLTISSETPGYKHEHVSGSEIRFKRGRTYEVPLEEMLMRDPFIIRYADGSYSYNCYHIATRIEAGTYDRSLLEAWDWNGIPLNHESMHKSVDRDTIQYQTFTNIRDDYDVIFNDDGNGEAADLVCFKDIDDETIKLCLVHCKGAHGGVVSQDIRNFYTVCGQAQKNITAKHKGIPHLYLDLKRRQEIWANEGYTRFLKGDMKMLSLFKDKSRRSKVDFEVLLVQPGASAQSITDDSLRLLATTQLFLKKTTDADFRVVVSP